MIHEAPRVSIVMTYYERAEQLKNTLRSFALHGYGPDVELIIVDDGSLVHKALYPEEEYKFPIKIIYLDPAKKWYFNPCVPFNVGFKACSGQLIIIQNAECLHVDNIVAHAVKNCDENSYLSYACYSLDKAHSAAIASNEDFSAALASLVYENRSCKNDGEEGWYNHSVYRPVAYHFCAAIPANLLRSIGGFDERYARGIGFDDDQFIYAIHKRKAKIKIIDDAVVAHQWHYSGGRISRERERKIFRNKQLFRYVTRGGLPYPVFQAIFGVTSLVRGERLVFRMLGFSLRAWKSIKRRIRIYRDALSRFLVLGLYQRIISPPDWRDIPIFINNRNRLSTTKSMVEWLRATGCRRIMILDNDSTYPPLLEYYQSLEREGFVEIKRLGRNVGAYSIWDTGHFRNYFKDYYVYTDSDLAPIADCPRDFLARFLDRLRKTPGLQKIGFGLQISDIPDVFEKKTAVVKTEEAYWKKPTADGEFYHAPIDTTFALYAPFQRGGPALRCLRSNYPYVLKHMPWYFANNKLDEEEIYYRKHANSYSSSNVNFAIYK